MERDEWIDLFNREIEPNAHTLAQALHEILAKNLIAGMQEAVDDLMEEGALVDRAFCEDIILPAMKRETYKALTTMCADSANGWWEVYLKAFVERWK